MLFLADFEILAIAAQNDRILVSHDRNTMISHFAHFTESQPSPGLLLVTQELEIGMAVEELLLIWAASDAEEWRNTIGFVPL